MKLLEVEWRSGVETWAVVEELELEVRREGERAVEGRPALAAPPRMVCMYTSTCKVSHTYNTLR